MLDLSQISRWRENNRLEAKLATGGLPQSLWETYSAFANTYGGGILLGVEELPDHSLRVQGLLDAQEMVEELCAMLDDRRVVSANILAEDQIRVAEVDGAQIIVMEVPPAPRDQLPVYLGKNPFTGSYRRSGDGDYHCTWGEVVTMLGDRDH